ncbi:MAG: DNA gyrase inhibitor YacG [Hyphomicrobiales bacterium]|nr:DNA gyrase inhibitor YacG [Hyphomicrobiales bacterium]MCP5372398.1 DNA gyrase inhibitor YacG [Hyphomicrobiales bacterium]
MAAKDPADKDPADKVVPLRGQRCPACGKPTAYGYRPFCSKRCADLDLGKWLSEDYRVATDEQPDQDDET